MKKLLLIIFLLQIFYCNAQYKSILADTSIRWNIYSSQIVFGRLEKIDTLRLGDTFQKNGNTYTELRGTGIFANKDTVLYGYLREDTTLGKAWFIKDTSNIRERIIYDLSLKKGDTLNVDFFTNLIVDSVYTLRNRKRIKLRLLGWYNYELLFASHNINYRYDSLEFIEGVGNSRGFICEPGYSFFNPHLAGRYNYLVCAFGDSQKAYNFNLPSSSPIISCDSLIIGTFTSLQERFSKNNLSIYPNPTRGRITLSNLQNITEIQVFNLQGQLLSYHTPLSLREAYGVGNEAISSGSNADRFSHTITIEGKAGIYLIKTIDEEGNTNIQKVIKQ